MRVFLFLSILLSCSSTSSFAFTSPIGFSIIPNLEFPPQKSSVAGLRINIWGRHVNMYGIDLGLIRNQTTKQFVGLQFSGISNLAMHSTIIGFQIAGINNVTNGKVTILGLQAAGLFNLNSYRANIVGLQIAPVNTAERIVGAQLGIVNHSVFVNGVQIGVVNIAKSLVGVQLGLINIASNSLTGFFPVFNIAFW